MTSVSAPMCPYCQQPAVLVDSAVIYGRSYGWAWQCAPCDAYVGCHPGSKTALGSPANAALRALRSRAHAAFDPFWRQPRQRVQARSFYYARLAAALGIAPADCHIGMFDEARCRATLALCRRWIIEEPT